MKEAIFAAIVAAVVGGLGLATIDPPSGQVQGGIPDTEPVAVMQPQEIVAEPADDYTPMAEPEPIYAPEWEEPVFAPDEEETGPQIANDAPDLKSAGVVEDGGKTYTWYSENVLPGGGLDDLNANGRTLDDRGFVTDGEGFIAVASPDESLPIGTEVETPWGMARVYDYNPGGSYDVYTGW